MPGVEGGRPNRMRLSIIVPFHHDLVQLRQCLSALRIGCQALPGSVAATEVIVVADGTVDDPSFVAEEAGARVLAIDGPRGPAVARNRGGADASGDLIVFVDSDVVVSDQALTRFVALFTAEPDLAAAFGAYDEDPADAGFISVARNLAHSFIHQRSRRDAQTFW